MLKGDKSSIKVVFEVTFRGASGILPNTNNQTKSQLFLVWKRGSKKNNRGETKHAELGPVGQGQGQGAQWNETFTIHATMLQHERHKKFDKKILDVVLKEVQENAKKARELGSLGINLGDFAANGTSVTKEFKFARMKGFAMNPSLSVHIQSRWAKVDGKTVVKKPAGQESGHDDYDLVTDEDGSVASETSELDTGDEESEVDASDSEWDGSDTEDPAKRQTKEKNVSAAKDAPPESERGDPKKPGEEDQKSLSGSVDSVNKKLKKSEKEKKKLIEKAALDKKKLSKAKRENESLKRELEQAKAREQSKDQSQEAMKVEVERLRKEVEDAKVEAGRLRSEVESSSKAVEDSRRDAAEKAQQIESLEKEAIAARQRTNELAKEMDELRKEAEKSKNEAAQGQKKEKEELQAEIERLRGEVNAKDEGLRLSEAKAQEMERLSNLRTSELEEKQRDLANIMQAKEGGDEQKLVETMRESLKNKEDELSKVRQQLEEKEGALIASQKREGEVQKAEDRLAQLLHEIETQGNALRAQEEQMAELQQGRETALKQLKERDDVLNEKTRQIAELQEAVERATKATGPPQPSNQAGGGDSKKENFKQQLAMRLQQGGPPLPGKPTSLGPQQQPQQRPEEKEAQGGNNVAEDKKAAFRKQLQAKLQMNAPGIPLFQRPRPSADPEPTSQESKPAVAPESCSEIVRPTTERLRSMGKDRPMQVGKRPPTRIGGSTIRRPASSDEAAELQQLGARDQEISELQEKLRTAQGNTPFASPPPATEDQEKNEESARLKEELAETRADLQKNQEVVQELERIKLDLQKKEEEEEELERVKADLRKKVEVEEELFRIRADLQKKAEIEEELASIRADLRKKDQVEQELATVKADLQKKREIEEELARARADLQQRDEELTHFKDTEAELERQRTLAIEIEQQLGEARKRIAASDEEAEALRRASSEATRRDRGEQQESYRMQREETTRLQLELQSREEELARVKSAADETRAEQEAELEHQRSRVADLEQQLADALKRIATAEEEVEATRKAAAEAAQEAAKERTQQEAELRRRDEDLARLKAELQGTEDEVRASQEAEIERLRAQVVELEKQLDAAKTEADALQQRIESVRREAEAQLKEATTRMEAELHSRDEKLVRLKEQHQTAEAEGRNRQEAELERQLARARADELVKRSTESTQQCDAEASSKEEALRAELQKRQEEIERLQAELRSTNEELKLVKAMRLQQGTELESHQARMASIEEQLAIALKRAVAAEDEADTLRKGESHRNEEKEVWAQQLADLREQLEAAVRERAELEERECELQTMIDAHTKALTQWDEERSSLQTRLAEAAAARSSESSKQASENEERLSRMASIEREADEAKRALASLQQTVEHDLTRTRSRIAELEATLEKEEQSTEDAQRRAEEAEAELIRRVQQFQTEIQQLEQQLQGGKEGGKKEGEGTMRAKAKALLRRVRDFEQIEQMIYGNDALPGTGGNELHKGDGEDVSSTTADPARHAERLLEFLSARAAFEGPIKHDQSDNEQANDTEREVDDLLPHISSSIRAAVHLGPQDRTIQCRWLGFCTHLLNLIVTNDSLRELFPVEAIRDIDPKKYGILVTPAEPTEEPSSEGKREGKTKGRKRGGAKKETVTQQTHQNNKKERANVAFIRGLQETVVEVYRNILACVQAKIEPYLLPAILAQPGSVFSTPVGQKNALSPTLLDQLKDSLMTPEDIVAGLDEMLASLCSAHIFPVIIRQFCMQIFYWMDTCLFNLLAKADQLCTCGNGFQIKYALVEVTQWLRRPTVAPYIDPHTARVMLPRINEAVTVLVMDRSVFFNESTVHEVFPSLNPVQLMHLLECLHPDELSSEPVPVDAKQLLARMAGKARSSMFLQFDPSVLLPYEPSTPL